MLLAAATLKAYQVMTDPSLGILHGSRWLSAGLVGFEIALAWFLLSGVRPRSCRNIALATFVGFACVSLYLAVTGVGSCGCFGSWHVPPGITMAVDLLLAFLLWCWQPAFVADQEHPYRETLAVLKASILPVAVLVALTGHRLVTLLTESSPSDSIMILEPETWIGLRCPLLQHIDIGPSIEHGSWRVVLYHHDCSQCQAVLPRYKQLANENGGSEGACRIALIEVPPYSRKTLAPDQSCQHGRLSDEKEWFVTTPAELVLRDGRLVEARIGEEVAAAIP